MSLLRLTRSLYLDRATAVVDVGTVTLLLRDGALYVDRDGPRAGELAAALEPETNRHSEALRRELETLATDTAGRRYRRRTGAAADVIDPVGPLPTAYFLMALAVLGCGERELLQRVGGTPAVLVATADSAAAALAPPLAASQARLLGALSRPMSIDSLLHDPRHRLEGLRDLARLMAIGLVEREVAAKAIPDPGTVSAELVAPRTVRRFAASIAASLEAEPLARSAADHRAAVVELWRSQGEQNHYQLLEIERSADDETIHLAFAAIARLVHPTHAERLGLGTSDAMLEVLFERAVDAYLTLSDGARRIAYNRPLGLRATIEVDQRQRGEEKREMAAQCYRQGTNLLAANEISSAVDVLKEAVRLDPQPRYLSVLARTQTKNRAWHRHAYHNYRQAIQLAPDDAGLRVGLGTLLERLDRPDEAIEAYREALRSMPDHAEAKIALDRLGASSASSSVLRLKGLLSRDRGE